MRWLTPPQVAAQLGVDPGKVIGWIRRGELTAVNVAESLGGRPRYRISPDALKDFLKRRQTGPQERPTRRRRTKDFERKYYT